MHLEAEFEKEQLDCSKSFKKVIIIIKVLKVLNIFTNNSIKSNTFFPETLYKL